MVIEAPTHDGARINGIRRRWHTLAPEERVRLVAPGGSNALLAVQAGGRPFVDRATVLRRIATRIQDRYEPGFPHVHPHVTRHSFAMATLERLVGGYYQQAAQLAVDAGNDDAMALYLTKADPLLVLRDLLGLHRHRQPPVAAGGPGIPAGAAGATTADRRHPAARAFRTPLNPNSLRSELKHLTSWFNHPTSVGVASATARPDGRQGGAQTPQRRHPRGLHSSAAAANASWRRAAEATICSTWPTAGDSTLLLRHRRNSASTSRSRLVSIGHISPASHLVRFFSSSSAGGRVPNAPRICAW